MAVNAVITKHLIGPKIVIYRKLTGFDIVGLHQNVINSTAPLNIESGANRLLNEYYSIKVAESAK